MWGCMCSTGPLNREDIFIAHLITIIIKSEVSTFPIVSYLSMVVCLRWLYHHVLSVSYISQESWVLFLLLLCSLIMCANKRVHYGPMVVFSCLLSTLPHYHHCADCADVSEGNELPKCLPGTFLSSVCLRLIQFSQLNFMQYIRLCIFSLPIYLTSNVRIHVFCLIIIIKSQVWPICHCLGLGQETMLYAVCPSIFFFLYWIRVSVPDPKFTILSFCRSKHMPTFSIMTTTFGYGPSKIKWINY